MGKVCFLFGNRHAPNELAERIEAAAMRCYSELGVRTFIVGHYGNFNRIAATAVMRLKKRLPDITLLMLTPYHPWERPIQLTPGWDNTYYPEGMESVPRQYAIVRDNEYMIRCCHCAICYAVHIGNSRKLLEKLRKRNVPIFDLSE